MNSETVEWWLPGLGGGKNGRRIKGCKRSVRRWVRSEDLI